jgi:dTDP-4-amino-4,6-dideoxygalactose transaminase
MMSKEEVDAVKKVLDSGWLAEGKITRQFEDAVARYVGSKYAVATCNCTVALELCLRASNLIGKEVIIPSFTHPATIQAVLNALCIPVLVDVDLQEYNMQIYHCSNDVETFIPVSWGGNPVWSVPLESLIFEDAACSLGSSTISEGALTPEMAVCYSFHPRKLVTTGEGGMIVTNNKELATKLRKLKNFGYGNYKFDDVRAAIGNEQMKKIDKIINRRIEMAETYNDLLANVKWVRIPQKHPLAKHTYQTYAVYLTKGNRNIIIKRLAKKGIETQVGAYALHLLYPYHFRRFGSLSNSELLHHNLLALPMSYDLSDDDQVRVVEELKQAISKTSNN